MRPNMMSPSRMLVPGIVADHEQFLGKGGAAIDIWKNAWYLRGDGDNYQEQGTAGNQPTVNARDRDFDGSDYMSQKEQDSEQGALTFVADGGTAEFRDAGQDFSDWETTSGNALFRIVITTNNGKSYAYLGASNNSGLDIDCYTDIALTSRGWKGRTTPQASPDTPATYEIYKVVGTDNLTTDFWGVVVVKPDDGQPAGNETLFSRWDTNDNLMSWRVLNTNVGKLLVQFSNNGVYDANKSEITDAVVWADGAQTDFTVVGIVKSGTSCTIYINGSAVASTTGGNGIPATLFDTYAPLSVAVVFNPTPADYLNGAIGLTIIGTGTPTANDFYWQYHRTKLRYV